MPYERIVLASGNRGKLKEIGEFFSQLGITIVDPKTLGVPPEVEETADSYQGNALLKAEALFAWSGIPCLADDTGLEVEALDSAPGLYTARFAGENCSYDDNINKMLMVMKGVENRRAKFICCLVLVRETGSSLVVQASLPGIILSERKGAGGFGYDPIFQPDNSEFSLAELKSDGRNFKTHRILALEKMAKLLD